MITASSLTERIGIYVPETTRDEHFGGQRTAYRHAQDVWASVRFLKGARALEHGEVYMQNSISVTTRLHPVLTDSCHIHWDGKTYQIDSFNRSRTDGSVIMTCSRIDTGNPSSEAMVPDSGDAEYE